MKLVHLSDLHLGKKFYGFDLKEEQRDIFQQIQEYIMAEQPDAVLIAGDIYDVGHQAPPWAVSLFGDFLAFLHEMKPKPEVFIIAGNHDSAERLSYASELFGKMGIHISQSFQGSVEVVTVPRAGMEDVCFYLLPYVHPYQCGKDENGNTWGTYDEAVGAVLDTLVLNPNQRHIMMTHQYIDDIAEGKSTAEKMESERYIRGGTEAISVERFKDFEYVALGHLHAPQWIKYKHVRYCGTPLPYSVQEGGHTKSLTVVEIGEKPASGERASVEVRELILDRCRKVRILTGMSEDLLDIDYAMPYREDFVRLVLLDKERVAGMAEKLRKCYPRYLDFHYKNIGTRGVGQTTVSGNLDDLQPLGMFQSFFAQQETVDKGEDSIEATLNEVQEKYLEDLIAEIWGGHEE